ncbi:hypothetical protein NLI96_g2294 [Meripilus lineatus]|uniref:Lysophospholipase n=1 Tax=Meripilus lineatus TaxID=2056292 RepID=A0AAD5V8W8_9APHY|nr:hypothetical protein NLI96_g2294 [Physisporinus lineatus]
MNLLISAGLLALLGSFSSLVVAQQAAAVAYAPKFTLCPPNTSLIRSAGTSKQSLSPSESSYISARKSQVLPSAWSSYLKNVKQAAKSNNIALPAYVSAILSQPTTFPNLGIATSGGGYRAAIFGAGVLNALDGRNLTSSGVGTGGLLQAASYLSGLSGGSWLLGSLIQADFPPLLDLIFGTSSGLGGWNAQVDLLQISTDPNVIAQFVGLLVQESAGKFLTGFPVTFTDIWARTLSRHFVTGTTAANFFDTNLTHGAGVTLSSITQLPTFAQHAQPFPIIVANSLTATDTEFPPLMNPIFEFTPFEFGSFDPQLSAFTPTQFLGSPNNSLCVTNMDQLGFVEGISSNLFSAFNTSETDLLNSNIGPIISALQSNFGQKNIRLDSSQIPNPFFGLSKGSFVDSDQTLLTLVDGGLDGEVIPLQPLLVKARKVDTIIAIDASADTLDNFAAGASVVASSQRAALFPKSYSFPPVPASNTSFLSQNLTTRPTFFGCNTRTTDDAPLLIYIANGGAPLGQTPVTNTTTLQTTYPAAEIQQMVEQTFDIATQGISTIKNGVASKEKTRDCEEWGVQELFG